MPSLSFTEMEGSRPIAMVRGGDLDGEIVYLNESNQVCTVKRPTADFSVSRYSKELKGLKPLERSRAITRLEAAHHAGLKSEHLAGETEAVKKLYERLMSDSQSSTTINLPEGSEFVLLPSADKHKRDVFLVAGASGSGKSYIARSIAENYRKLFPGREIYLISKLNEDSTLDKMRPPPHRINVDTLITDYPELDEFKDCLVIFDDVDSFTGAHEKVIHKLKDDLATMGRHTNTTMLWLSHYLTQYSKTRLILNECTHVVVYPQSTSFHALRYLLKNYIGIDEDDVKDMRKWGSRWLAFGKNFPQFVISTHKAKLLHCD